MKPFQKLDLVMLWVARAFVIYLLVHSLIAMIVEGKATNVQALTNFFVLVGCEFCLWDNKRPANRLFLAIAAVFLMVTFNYLIVEIVRLIRSLRPDGSPSPNLWVWLVFMNCGYLSMIWCAARPWQKTPAHALEFENPRVNSVSP